MIDNAIELTPEAAHLWQEIAPKMQHKIIEIKKTPVAILIWGPSPCIDTPVGRIRLELRSELRKIGHLAVFSEELLDSSLNISNRSQQLMQAEEFQLIISIPASPGAIGEIHDFVIDTRVNSRIIVFLNQNYDSGYSNQSLSALENDISFKLYYYKSIDDLSYIIRKSIEIAEKIQEYIYLLGRRP